MYSVALEIEINSNSQDKFFDVANKFKEHLLNLPSCLSLKRYDGLIEEKKILSLSLWKNLNSVKSFKENIDFLTSKGKNKGTLVKDYRIRISKMKDDYILE